MKPRIAVPEPCSYDSEYSSRALPPYLRAIENSGGQPVVISLNSAPEVIARQITECSAVLLPGSKADIDPQKYGAEQNPKNAKSDPLRDAADELLLQDAYNLRKPILGICYGLQALNVWRSGTLLQHIESETDHSPGRPGEMAHKIVVEPNSLLARTMHAPSSGTISVNSSHHQSAGTLGDGLRAVAHCSEDGIVEAIEGTQADHAVIAVQWHPEKNFQDDPPSAHLFEWIKQEASRWRTTY